MGGWLGRTLLVPNLNQYMWALFFQVRFPEFLRTLPPAQARDHTGLVRSWNSVPHHLPPVTPVSQLAQASPLNPG